VHRAFTDGAATRSGPAITASAPGGEVSGDRVIVTAILDRVLHHAVTLNIRDNSDRLAHEPDQRFL